MTLHRNDGTLIRELGDSNTPELANYRMGLTEMLTIPTADGYQLPAEWTLPVDFNPAHRYPVLISIYGGREPPVSRMAGNRFRSNGWQTKGLSRSRRTIAGRDISAKKALR